MSEDAPAPAGWWLYVLRCEDDTLYVGVTTDLHRRLHEHNATARGARYTRARRPVSLAGAWPQACRSSAQQAEAAFRRLRRPQKLARLAAAPVQELPPLEEAPEQAPEEVLEDVDSHEASAPA